ncbi:MAG TPA: hypothetical protein VGS27_24965 [Candidatus Sulfotelmatobacter sp.]|nr:hypothetical protein [Candidatus Sulfotelmatobacter sp.]
MKPSIIREAISDLSFSHTDSGLSRSPGTISRILSLFQITGTGTELIPTLVDVRLRYTPETFAKAKIQT